MQITKQHFGVEFRDNKYLGKDKKKNYKGVIVRA